MPRMRPLPAAEEAADGGDPAAQHEPGDRRADHHVALVAHDVLAPVRGLGELGAQVLERAAELLAVGLDGGADLVWGALRHQSPWTVSRMRWASSMARSGLGDDPRLKKREARKPARPPRTNSTAATRKNPQKICDEFTGSAHQANHAKPWMRIDRPKMAKTAAAAPMAAPLASDWTFSVTSALASSISSRTRTCARSEISCTAAVISFGRPVGSAAKTLE